MRTIMDTDIGTDIDDTLALALMLASSEIDLIGITCVYGDVGLRAKIALKLLTLAGVDEVPVYMGASQPLLGIGEIFWEGHEGKALFKDDSGDYLPEDVFAVDYIVNTVRAFPNDIHILAIGPLTNIALALKKAPDIVDKVAHLTIMGGVVRGYGDLGLPIAEHNIQCDPEAAHIVMTSRIPITLVPLNITVQTKLDQSSVDRIRAGGSTFHDVVAHELEIYSWFVKYGASSPHDPLALATMIDSSLITTHQVDAVVDISQGVGRGATHFVENPDGNIALVETVNSSKFKEFLLSRLEKPL